MKGTAEASTNRIITLPNLLSVFRILLIPLFMWTYCAKQDSLLTALLLLLSGVTDSLDGFIARKYHLISNLGKALDPIADKLTQGAMLLCLITRYPLMLLPFILLIIKEASVGISSLVVIKKTGSVHGAVWHGKVTTCMLYTMMIVHVLWGEITAGFSAFLIITCTLMMVISFLLYILRNIRFLQQNHQKSMDTL